jgi:beta-mannosidase
LKLKKALPQKFILSKAWKLLKTLHHSIPLSIKFPDQGIPATVPGTVHTDLLMAGLIPDPFFGSNEKKLAWIHKNEWIYETNFDLPSEFRLDKPIHLICEGLDTICDIRLNGKLLGQTENMFRQFRFTNNNVITEQNNHLQLYFHSPSKVGQHEEKRFGKLWGANNTERVFLRKAQYSFGWDWGPSFPTMGIWKPIYLYQSNDVCIGNVRFHTSAIHDKSAVVMVEIVLDGKTSEAKSVNIDLKNGDHVLHKNVTDLKSTPIQQVLKISNPRLWYPSGAGEANLYQLKVYLINQKNERVDEWIGHVGIRTVYLETKSKGKSSFCFVINGKPIYMKGANWIPADSFLPRISLEKYEFLLSMAKDSGINMLRVWGGGIYENDIFYELCDRLGLLVWQDFMFACGHYPEHQAFLYNIEEEFIQNINRLQHHPSLALWCGNNENEWGWFMDYGTPVKNMPGYQIYHQIIPNILKRLDPLRPYWPSSPFGSEQDPNSEKSGNRHQWDIWSSGVDYPEVKSDRSLFVAEFGFQGPANRITLENALPKSEWQPEAPAFLFHNKQDEGNDLVIHFLNCHLPLRNNWQDFIYLTQLNQGFALKTCIEHWRSRWPKTAGSIIWQLNDCWPVTSWSLIDSDLIPKIAYYFVKKAFSKILVYFKERDDVIDVFLLNCSSDQFKGVLKILIIDLKSGNVIGHDDFELSIMGDDNKKIHSYVNQKVKESNDYLFVASCTDLKAQIIQRNYFLRKRWKDITLPVSTVNLDMISNENSTALSLSADKPTFFIDLFHPKFTFSDRGFILLPDEVKHLEIFGNGIQNLKIDKVKIYTLNKYLKT